LDGETVRVLCDTRDAVRRLGGSLLVERCPPHVKRRLDVWGDVGDSLAVMRRMKRQYDPKRVLNPGRFVGGI
jgi:glycolate oxidase FAD binding subunit